MKTGSLMSAVAAGMMALVVAQPALAVPKSSSLALDSTTQCSEGNAINGIAVGDVVGNLGGATDCWGTFDGNDPGPNGEIVVDGVAYKYVAKQNTPGDLEGADIGLVVTPSGGAEEGEWSFDSSLFDPNAFLIVLKAANSPGFAVWLFEGDDADSSSGAFEVAWGHDLSHLSIYSRLTTIPIPAAGLLLLGALGGLGYVGRRKRA